MRHSPASGPQGPGSYPSLVGRAVVVTGGGQGIGRRMALALAERGAGVVATAARDLASLEETEAMARGLPGRVLALRADVRDPEDCARTVALAREALGGLDALVNNAARGIAYVREATGGAPTGFWEADAERWAETMATNVVGAFRMSAAAAPGMIAQGFGRIVNVSTSDRSMVRPMNSPYGPSKAALEAMSAAWAKELVERGVTVNVLLPGGATRTRMATGASAKPLHPPEIMNAAILWLCSDRSSGHTGGRYVAEDWDPDGAPDDAAAGARRPRRGLPAIM